VAAQKARGLLGIVIDLVGCDSELYAGERRGPETARKRR
jgi:hypothetical protein